MGVTLVELGKVGITPRGAFSTVIQNGDGYSYLDTVNYNGSGYLSLIDANNQLPTNTEAWMLWVEKGSDGATAYQLAVAGGFSGTLAEWLVSLQGDDGASAYEVAVANGFVGTEAEWLLSLKGADGTGGGSGSGNLVYLAENLVVGVATLTQAMVAAPNTVYVIRYDYDLDEEIIQIPANCTLQFEGGSLTNGKVFSDNETTKIVNPPFVDFGVNDMIFFGCFFNSAGQELTYKFEPHNRPFTVTAAGSYYPEMLSKRHMGINRYNAWLTMTGETLETLEIAPWEKANVLAVVNEYNAPIADLRIQLYNEALPVAKYTELCTAAIDWVHANIGHNVKRISVNNEATSFYTNSTFVTAHLAMVAYAQSLGYESGITHYLIHQENSTLVSSANYALNTLNAANMDYYGYNFYPYYGGWYKQSSDIFNDEVRMRLNTKRLTAALASNQRRGFDKLFISESGFSAFMFGMAHPDIYYEDADLSGSILIRAWTMWFGLLKQYARKIDTVNMWALPHSEMRGGILASEWELLAQNMYKFLLKI